LISDKTIRAYLNQMSSILGRDRQSRPFSSIYQP